MHLILDLDGTLVGDHNEPLARPHLTHFLDFCFERFDSVSIWTAASPNWAYACINALMSKYPFHQILTLDFCQIEPCNNCEVYPVNITKPLSKLWNTFPEMTPQNTIIIEDTPETCVHNPKNYIQVPRYIDGPDESLQDLVSHLDRIIQVFQDIPNVQIIDLSFHLSTRSKMMSDS